MKKLGRNITLRIAASGMLLLSVAGVLAQSKNCFHRLEAKDFADSMLCKENVELIDMRAMRKNFKVSLKGAQHFSSKASLRLYLDSLDRDIPIFIYCDTGERSQQASKMVCEMEFNQVYDLIGGINAWKKENLPIINHK